MIMLPPSLNDGALASICGSEPCHANSPQRRSLAAVQRRGRLEEHIWTSLPVATLAVNGKNEIVDMNPAAELLLNRSLKSVRGRSLVEWAVDAGMMTGSLEEVRARQSRLLLDDVGLSLDAGTVIDTSLNVAPIADVSDHLLICIRSREVEDRISRGKRSKTAALSAVGMAELLSHEIKNPLTGIQGAAQLLSMHSSGEDLELTRLIVDETHRILKLLSQVEQFGSIKVLEIRPLNVHDVLDRACRVGKVGFAAGTRFEKEFDPSLPPIGADADKLMQVFLNLIKNASEAIGEFGGAIRVRTYYDDFLRVGPDDGTRTALPVQVEIIDNGRGIRPDLAPNVFEPFVSGRINGSGLGLTFVSAILAEMGGWVNFESAPGNTVFRVSLPVAEAN